MACVATETYEVGEGVCSPLLGQVGGQFKVGGRLDYAASRMARSRRRATANLYRLLCYTIL